MNLVIVKKTEGPALHYLPFVVNQGQFDEKSRGRMGHKRRPCFSLEDKERQGLLCVFIPFSVYFMAV
jgi:hypothetical protein